jgi:hypothetical protein
LTDGLTYRWSIFLTPTGSNHLGALAWRHCPGPVARALQPSIQIVGYPPTIPAGSNFAVKVQYTSAASDAVVQVNILDSDYHWHGGGTVPARRGEGLVDVTVSPQPTLTNGAYVLECFLSNSSTNWQNVMARSENRAVQAGPVVAEELIQALPQPDFLPVGEVFRFLVTYAAATNRDLHVDLLDANTNFVAGTVQRVGVSGGVQELTLSVPEAPPGTCFVNSFLTAPGETWTEALAWGAMRPVTVLARSYYEWAEWRWGILLGTDAVLPGQDADGDGASNEAERIAHTSPLNRADVLHLAVTSHGGQIVLAWRSAVDRQYQVFESSELFPASWTALGGALNGTGDVLQVTIDPSGTGQKKFHRLEVWQAGER